MTTLSRHRELIRQQPPSSDFETETLRVLPEKVTRNRHADSVITRDALPDGCHLTPDTSSHIAHHYANAKQQFEAAKLGMWLFLATEFLLFGGLFCLYAVFRHTHPEIFRYGARFLDVNLGLLNTTVLILSSMTMAWAVRCAQLNQRRRLLACLLLTIAGGATFMGVKYLEYSHKISHNLVWGVKFYQAPAHDEGAPQGPMLVANIAAAEKAGDAARGQALWMGTCRSCHDVDGRGISGQGKDIRDSAFIASKTDKELVEFIKAGRMPFDKLNTTGIQMPPRGGNPMLKDEQLRDIVAYVRTFKAPDEPSYGHAAVGQSDAGATAAAQASAKPGPSASSSAINEDFYIPRSSIADASAGPPGLAAGWNLPPPPKNDAPPPDPRYDPDRPRNAHLFFGIYFLMTGLHGLHVLAGMACISWLAVRAYLGHFTSGYFTPVDLVGLYWHVVDVIWIFLFPLLYLIH